MTAEGGAAQTGSAEASGLVVKGFKCAAMELQTGDT